MTVSVIVLRRVAPWQHTPNVRWRLSKGQSPRIGAINSSKRRRQLCGIEKCSRRKAGSWNRNAAHTARWWGGVCRWKTDLRAASGRVCIHSRVLLFPFGTSILREWQVSNHKFYLIVYNLKEWKTYLKPYFHLKVKIKMSFRSDDVIWIIWVLLFLTILKLNNLLAFRWVVKRAPS